jgi:hypothetical protein
VTLPVGFETSTGATAVRRTSGLATAREGGTQQVPCAAAWTHPAWFVGVLLTLLHGVRRVSDPARAQG